MSDTEEPAVAYGNCHRAFLQHLNSRGTITYEEAKPVLAAIQSANTPDRATLPEDITSEDFEDYINALQEAVSPLDFEIRSSLHQKTKERIYALVNTTSDNLTQMATMHTPDEIAFVKRVLDAMFVEYNTAQREIMAITSNQALRLHKAPNEVRRESQTAANAGLTQSQAEKVMESLHAEGWFDRSNNGFYSLSQRGIMELKTWLIDMYNEQPDDDEDEDEEPHVKIKMCAACREIITSGQRCPNLVCDTRLHDGCQRVYFRAQQNTEQCGKCKTKWENAPFVGEKAAPNVAGRRKTTNGNGRSSNGTNGRRRSQAANEDESDASAGASD